MGQTLGGLNKFGNWALLDKTIFGIQYMESNFEVELISTWFSNPLDLIYVVHLFDFGCKPEM